jgi:hypothetical protein
MGASSDGNPVRRQGRAGLPLAYDFDKPIAFGQEESG